MEKKCRFSCLCVLAGCMLTMISVAGGYSFGTKANMWVAVLQYTLGKGAFPLRSRRRRTSEWKINAFIVFWKMMKCGPRPPRYEHSPSQKNVTKSGQSTWLLTSTFETRRK